MKNLADDPAHAGQLKKMRAALEEARKDYGDQQPLTVQNPEPKEAVYDNAKRTLDVWQPKWIRDKYFGGRSRTDHGPGAGKKK